MATYVRQERNYVDLNEYQCLYLRDANDSIEMNIDGSSTPVEFTYTVLNDYYLLLHRICFVIISSGAVNADEFGGIKDGLDNGVLLSVERKGNIIKDLFAGQPIKRNAEWASFAGVDVSNLAGDEGIVIGWTFTQAAGFPMRLHPNDILRATIQDNLTSLVIFRTMIHGLLVSKEAIEDERLK